MEGYNRLFQKTGQKSEMGSNFVEAGWGKAEPVFDLGAHLADVVDVEAAAVRYNDFVECKPK